LDLVGQSAACQVNTLKKSVQPTPHPNKTRSSTHTNKTKRIKQPPTLISGIRPLSSPPAFTLTEKCRLVRSKEETHESTPPGSAPRRSWRAMSWRWEVHGERFGGWERLRNSELCTSIHTLKYTHALHDSMLKPNQTDARAHLPDPLRRRRRQRHDGDVRQHVPQHRQLAEGRAEVVAVLRDTAVRVWVDGLGRVSVVCGAFVRGLR
jgi:hypothetical protein